MKSDHVELAKSFILGIAVILITLWAIEAVSVFAPSIYGDAKATISQWGAPGVFVGVFLGSTLLPFPTDLFYITAVNLAQSTNDKIVMFVIALIAGAIGAMVNYWLARVFREKFVHNFVSEQQLAEAKRWFDKYGPYPILIFGIFPASPVFDPVTFIAGLTGMDFKEFSVFAIASRAIHFALLALIASNAGLIPF